MSNPQHETRAHSKLGASSAHRWGVCPASIRLSEGQPNKSTIYAAEGTAAHELGDMCLTNNQDAIEYIGRIIKVEEFEFEVDEGMAEAVQVYLDAVRAEFAKTEGAELLIEHKFDLSNVILPGMFGTNDAAVYHPSTRRLVVFDYKHGQGYAVEVEENPQLLYYGVGAATSGGRLVEEVEIVVVQPRAPHRHGPVRRWSTDFFGLLDYATTLRVLAEKTMDPEAPLVSGSHCKFCPAAGVCPQLEKDAIAAARADFGGTPAELPERDLAAILDKADLIEDWISAVRKHAFYTLDSGGYIDGYKLVAKKSNRKWIDDNEDALLSKLELIFGLSVDDVTRRKVLTPAQVEKLLGKEDKKALAEFYDKPDTGVTMARDTDPRPAVSATRNALTEFEAV